MITQGFLVGDTLSQARSQARKTYESRSFPVEFTFSREEPVLDSPRCWPMV